MGRTMTPTHRMRRSLRELIREQLETEQSARKGLSATNWALLFLILASLVLYTAETEREFEVDTGGAYWWLNLSILGVFLVEFVLRLYASTAGDSGTGWRALVTYAKTNWFMVGVDFLAFGPELVLLAAGFPPPSWLRALRVARLLKMARYFSAFRLVVDALKSCIQELLVALSLSAMLWYVASVALYLAEKDAQPEKFGSITRSMWWSVATLTTVGYGDVYPVTVLGEVLAGIVAVIGLGTVALPSGIIAGAFLEAYREKRRGNTRHP